MASRKEDYGCRRRCYTSYVLILLFCLWTNASIAGPTSADGTPSLAAVVASIDADFVQFPASMELQASKEEVGFLRH